MKRQYRTWKMSDLKYIKKNIRKTDRELAEHFGCSHLVIKEVRLNNGIRKVGTKGYCSHRKGKKLEECMTAEKAQNMKQALSRYNEGKGRPMYAVYKMPSYEYWLIRTPENTRYMYARYVYEQHYGVKLDKCQKIRYLDGDTWNCDITNLAVESNVEKAKRANMARVEKMKVRTLNQYKQSA